MIDYADTPACLRATILRYFGDTVVARAVRFVRQLPSCRTLLLTEIRDRRD